MRTTWIVLSAVLISSRLLWAAGAPADLGLRRHFGLEAYRYRYKETVRNAFFMQHRGSMFGIYGASSFRLWDSPILFLLDGRLARGARIHYRSYRGDDAYDRYTAFELRLTGSKSLFFWDGLAVEAYSGLALRFLHNALTDRRFDGGYTRSSVYRYVPIGARTPILIGHGTYLVVHAEYDWFLGGLQGTTLPRVDGTVAKERNRQRHGLGLQGGAAWQIPSGKYALDYAMGGFVRYWRIDDSEVSPNGFEPRNSTKEIGIRVGLAF